MNRPEHGGDGDSAVSVLELREVSKTYGQGPAAVYALAGVDLSVRAGEMVAVMGPSGSGKSTLLTIAGSLEEPTSGEVWVCGMALAGMPRGRKARLRRRVIGYVFQDFNLLPGLTAAENAALPLELDGVAVPKARAAGLAALEALGVAGPASRFPDQLSGGERQRVAIALLGAVLGMAFAVAASLVWAHASLPALFGDVPLTDVLILLVGLPLVAAAGGWLLAGREPEVIARQPLD
jgi:predicted ABC-type transport system involved in lysophospholipase L1 biosynthesis ATPase subunit